MFRIPISQGRITTIGGQGTKYFAAPLWGEPHRRRSNFLFNGYLAVKKSGNFVARLQQNKLLLCERRRRERKFSIFKFSIAAVRRQFTHSSEVGGPQMPGVQGQCLVCLVDDPSLPLAVGFINEKKLWNFVAYIIIIDE